MLQCVESFGGVVISEPAGVPALLLYCVVYHAFRKMLEICKNYFA
jgi:hypothetical protein